MQKLRKIGAFWQRPSWKKRGHTQASYGQYVGCSARLILQPRRAMPRQSQVTAITSFAFAFNF
jgi:hypothetical protein